MQEEMGCSSSHEGPSTARKVLLGDEQGVRKNSQEKCQRKRREKENDPEKISLRGVKCGGIHILVRKHNRGNLEELKGRSEGVERRATQNVRVSLRIREISAEKKVHRACLGRGLKRIFPTYPEGIGNAGRGSRRKKFYPGGGGVETKRKKIQTFHQRRKGPLNFIKKTAN